MVFIYAKEGEIKVLDSQEALRLHDTLKKEGWVHTRTFNPCALIEYLHNECEDANNHIKSFTRV